MLKFYTSDKNNLEKKYYGFKSIYLNQFDKKLIKNIFLNYYQTTSIKFKLPSFKINDKKNDCNLCLVIDRSEENFDSFKFKLNYFYNIQINSYIKSYFAIQFFTSMFDLSLIFYNNKHNILMYKKIINKNLIEEDMDEYYYEDDQMINLMLDQLFNYFTINKNYFFTNFTLNRLV